MEINYKTTYKISHYIHFVYTVTTFKWLPVNWVLYSGRAQIIVHIFAHDNRIVLFEKSTLRDFPLVKHIKIMAKCFFQRHNSTAILKFIGSETKQF